MIFIPIIDPSEDIYTDPTSSVHMKSAHNVSTGCPNKFIIYDICTHFSQMSK